MSSNEASPQVTREQIADALRELGLAPGDSVFVHSSLSRFGRVEGGAEAVCLAVIDAVGPEGTVLMPAFTFDYVKAQNPVLDIERDPSCVGLIPETFRTRFATHRSRHITHSVAAAGARAEWFTSGHTRDAFCRESPLGRLIQAQGHLLLLGVDYNVCTFFHAIELALPVPYMGMTPKPDARIRLPGGEVIPADCSVHLPTMDYDFNRQGAALDSDRVARMTRCGNSLLRLLPAAETFECVLAELRRDPYALTRAGEEKVKVSVSVG